MSTSSNPKDDDNALSQISSQLLWPAVAGNVLWSLFSLLIDDQVKIQERAHDLVALLLIGIYLCGNWVRRLHHGNKKSLFLLFDVVHMLVVSLSALAIFYHKSGLADYFLSSVFLITCTMHLVGAGPTTEKSWKKRVVFGLANFLGFTVILAWRFTPNEWHAWNLTASIALVLIIWSALLLYFSNSARRN